jgi:hypothetical protein
MASCKQGVGVYEDKGNRNSKTTEKYRPKGEMKLEYRPSVKDC